MFLTGSGPLRRGHPATDILLADLDDPGRFKMSKSTFAPCALLSALAIAATGCAHQPPSPLTGELNVMQIANDMGYNQPRIINGQTLYCQNEALTGSMVPKVACVDSDQVVAMARRQGDEISYLQSAPNAIDRPPPPTPPH
jgi:hypothetical protein